MEGFADLVAHLLDTSGGTLIIGNKLTPSQPPAIVWGIIESDTETATSDDRGSGFAVSWTVAHSGTVEQVPFAVIDIDPHLAHDDESGTVQTLTPRRGDAVLMIRNADGQLTMLGKAEGISDG
ncbi:MAG: hypothetical protein OXC29_21370 [Rhodococcus sp.]|nr:hypothetical protein [Rhodococcus sp. (in: high G+C Gram-positive bacteria)]